MGEAEQTHNAPDDAKSHARMFEKILKYAGLWGE